MASKSALKGVKALIDANDFEKAAVAAQDILKQDSANYNALLFLGFAEEKLGRYEDAEKALTSASNLKDGKDVQSLKGLITLYEKQGPAKLDRYHDCVSILAGVYAQQEDVAQCQAVTDKYEIFARKHGTKAQYRHALDLHLPTNSLYSTLEGRIPHPSHTYKRILESAQAEEKDWINSQIAERRTRLGARIDTVTKEVNYEAMNRFELEQKFQALIDWTQDDEARHDLESQLLILRYELIKISPEEEKRRLRDQLMEDANGAVLIGKKDTVAWILVLEAVDAEDLAEWDPNIIRDYIQLFPEQGLAKVLRGFMDSAACPFPPLLNDADSDDAEGNERLSEADQLILMHEGIQIFEKSLLSHRVMALTYLSMEEYESAVESARKSLHYHEIAQRVFYRPLQNSVDGVNIILANALIAFQSPRNHPEARAIFEEILERKPLSTPALLGVGLILEEDEDYAEAVKFLARALDRDPSNMRIRLEHAWCRALNHEFSEGLSTLEEVLSEIEAEKTQDLVMKAETLYRIAYCKWELDTSAKARKDKSGPYQFLIAALKANTNYAPAYTLLGIYFQDYARNRKRARVAFQKAFELSTSELTAAERLAKQFADNKEWDLVELVAQRVVDSGKARPAPGSKKQSFSWPYAALGVVQMNKQQYSRSIVSFQHALRVSPEDYHSWVGLGESYHNAGRYIAAARAFVKGESLDHGLPPEKSWFAKYMLANVQRETGAFVDAIQGYENVLSIVKNEFGVLVALLQTTAEYAWARIAQGHFGDAAALAVKALQVAQTIANQKVNSFNLWKSVADACSVLSTAKAYAGESDLGHVQKLLDTGLDQNALALISDTDRTSTTDIVPIKSIEEIPASDIADQHLLAAILASKRAVDVSSSDVHAQAIAWYNLGWTEHNAYTSAGPYLKSKGKPRRFLKAAVYCFKHAIELEASNADFWNALGVASIKLNAKVSQHAFVRSLHLNDASAATWTNIGTLYLINKDIELANEAFTRAQSADPEYAAAWIGQGLLAARSGEKGVKEARDLFKHAFEIADSSSIPAKLHYANTAFDELLNDSNLSDKIENLIQPLFALRQLRIQDPSNVKTKSAHTLAHLLERVGEYDSAAETLQHICEELEAEYERSESLETLVHFAQAKADLGRQQLGLAQYEEAADNAQTALDLTMEADDFRSAAVKESRRKARLSAHLTSGIAHSNMKNMNESITMFQVALEELKSGVEDAELVHADVVCLLARVLWSHGGVEEREAARSQLLDCVQNNPEHVEAICQLSVIGLLDEDEEVLGAVVDDLKALQLADTDKVSVAEKIKITELLDGILFCQAEKAKGNSESDDEKKARMIAEATANVMLNPAQPQGWMELARVSRDEFAATMAVKTALKQIPPNGDLTAEDLARAYLTTGEIDDMRRAVMLTPWLRD